MTEEERDIAKKEAYRRYNSSSKGQERKNRYYENNEPDKEKQKLYSQKYQENLTEEEKELQKQRRREHMKRRRMENPVKFMVYDAKKRAKKKDIEFTISESDISIPRFCPVLGIELRQGDGKREASSPSLDRFDNNEGYIPDNVRVISCRANALKNDAELWEMELIVKYMRGEL